MGLPSQHPGQTHACSKIQETVHACSHALSSPAETCWPLANDKRMPSCQGALLDAMYRSSTGGNAYTVMSHCLGMSLAQRKCAAPTADHIPCKMNTTQALGMQLQCPQHCKTCCRGWCQSSNHDDAGLRCRQQMLADCQNTLHLRGFGIRPGPHCKT